MVGDALISLFSSRKDIILLSWSILMIRRCVRKTSRIFVTFLRKKALTFWNTSINIWSINISQNKLSEKAWYSAKYTKHFCGVYNLQVINFDTRSFAVVKPGTVVNCSKVKTSTSDFFIVSLMMEFDYVSNSEALTLDQGTVDLWEKLSLVFSSWNFEF